MDKQKAYQCWSLCVELMVETDYFTKEELELIDLMKHEMFHIWN